MSLTDLIWLATASYGLHVLEEYQLNWRDWARAVIGLPVQWSDFYVVNSLVIVISIVRRTSQLHGRESPSPFQP